jgi:hypothetical protein
LSAGAARLSARRGAAGWTAGGLTCHAARGLPSCGSSGTAKTRPGRASGPSRYRAARRADAPPRAAARSAACGRGSTNCANAAPAGTAVARGIAAGDEQGDREKTERKGPVAARAGKEVRRNDGGHCSYRDRADE